MVENSTTLEKVLARLSADYGAEPFVADEKGTYHIQCDTVELTILGREDSVRFSAPVIEVPETSLPKLALVILQVNHLFQGAEGASFSLDPEGKRLCLHEEITLTDEAELFAAQMAHFVSTVERWYILLGAYIEELQSGKPETSEVSEVSVAAASETEAPGLPPVPAGWLAV